MWKARNDLIFKKKVTSHVAHLQKIWHRLKLYIQDAWDKLLWSLKQGKISLEDAKDLFHQDFGSDQTVYSFNGHTIILPLMAPVQRGTGL